MSAEERLRDLTSRLGFGDGITEPQADNDTIVAWFEQQSRDASEWQDSQLWRIDCYDAGHPGDEDCYECDPRLRLERAEAALTTAAPTGYLVAPDAYDTPAIWRATDDDLFPKVVITRDALRHDLPLWDALVAAVERGRS